MAQDAENEKESVLRTITYSAAGNGQNKEAKEALKQLLNDLLDDSARDKLKMWLSATVGDGKDEDKLLHVARWVDLRTRLGDVLMVPALAADAAKAMLEMLKLRPLVVLEFYEELFTTRQKDLIKILGASGNDNQIISAFLDSASFVISCYFKYKSPIKEVPKFVRILLFDMFPMIIDGKFEECKAEDGNTAVGPYDVLKKMCLAADDLAACDGEYLKAIHKNERMVLSLVEMIRLGTKKLLQEKESGRSKELVTCAVEFLSAAIDFMNHILLAYFREDGKRRKANGAEVKTERGLYGVLFGEKSNGSKLCKACKRLLDWQSNEQETNEYLFLGCLDLLEMLCHSAYKAGFVLLDPLCTSTSSKSFYERIGGENGISDVDDSVCEFLASVMGTQRFFAYSFNEHNLKSRLDKILEENDEIKQIKHLTATVKLIVAALANSGIDSGRKRKLIQDLSGGPTETTETRLLKVIEKPTGDPTRVTLAAELLKYLTCKASLEKTGNTGQLPEAAELINNVVTEIRKCDLGQTEETEGKQDGESASSILSDLSNMDMFRSLILHSRGDWRDQYYYDTNLCKWYLSLQRESDAEEVLKRICGINEMTYEIDCLNDFLGAYNSARRDKSRSHNGLSSDIVATMCDTREWCAWPERTLDLLFADLLEKSEGAGVDPKKTTEEKTVGVLIEYVMVYPTACVFRYLAIALRQYRNRACPDKKGKGKNPDSVKSDPVLKGLEDFITNQKIYKFIVQTQSKDGLKCLTEGCSILLEHRIQDLHKIGVSLTKLFRDLQATELCADMLDLLSIVCSKNVLLSICQKHDLFDMLSGRNLSQYHTRDSPIWTHVFYFLLRLPHDSQLTWNYLCLNFDFVSFFMTERSGNHTRLSQNFLRTKCAVTDVLAHIADALPQLCRESTYSQKFLELAILGLESIIAEEKRKETPVSKKDLQSAQEHCLYVIIWLLQFQGAALTVYVDKLRKITDGIEGASHKTDIPLAKTLKKLTESFTSDTDENPEGIPLY